MTSPLDVPGPAGFPRPSVADVVGQLREDVPLVRRVMVATSDGLPLSDDGTPHSEPQEAAMSAAVLALGDQVGSTLGGGTFVDCIIHSTTAVVCVLAVGDRHVLAVSAAADVNLGLLLRQSRIAVSQLAPLLPGTPA